METGHPSTRVVETGLYVDILCQKCRYNRASSGKELIDAVVQRRGLQLFGHVARLDDDIPAKVVLQTSWAHHRSSMTATSPTDKPLIAYSIVLHGEHTIRLFGLRAGYARATRSDYVGRHGQDVRVRLFVCLSVCPEHNSKTNDHKVFKLGIGNDLGILLEVILFWSSKVKGQDHRVTSSFRILEPCILEPRFIDIHYVALPVVCGFADA